MRILIIWRDFPDSSHPSLARPYFLIKYNKNNDIYLISHINAETRNRIDNDLYLHCNRIELIEKHNTNTINDFIKNNIKTRLSIENILLIRDFNLIKSYSLEMGTRINKILESNEFDIIYADYMMAQYLRNRKIEVPIILEFFSPTLYVFKQQYLNEQDYIKKIKHIFKYLFYRLFEVPTYSEFDAGIYISESHKVLSKPFLTERCFIIPPGVDLDHFKQSSLIRTSPSLLFIGSMNYFVNTSSIIMFIDQIYPLIKAKIPEVKLYIVGRDPPEKLKIHASIDASIIITGAVKNLSDFYKYEPQVVIIPIYIDDGGIKTKVIEAMAMGKAIVSTSIGVSGMDVSNGNEILIADDPIQFAEYIVNLSKDDDLRISLGMNARKFAEKYYHWSDNTKLLESVLHISSIKALPEK